VHTRDGELRVFKKSGSGTEHVPGKSTNIRMKSYKALIKAKFVKIFIVIKEKLAYLLNLALNFNNEKITSLL